MTASIGLASSHWSSSFSIGIWITIFRHSKDRMIELLIVELSIARGRESSSNFISYPSWHVCSAARQHIESWCWLYNGNPKHITYSTSATLKSQYGESTFFHFIFKIYFSLIDILMNNDVRIGFIYSRWRWVHPLFPSLIILCLCSHSLYMMQIAYYVYWMGNEKCGKNAV